MKKNQIKQWSTILLISLLLVQCQSQEVTEEAYHHDDESEVVEVHLSKKKVQQLNIKTDTIPHKIVYEYVQANGHLDVPPQHEASVTAILGANILSIEVVEGTYVKRGAILGYLAHPDLIKIQTDYQKSYHHLQYLKEEYQRKTKLFNDKIASEKEYQAIKSKFLSTKGACKGWETQLKLLNMNPKKIKTGYIYKSTPIVSPISGFIEDVDIKIGQFVSPSTPLFELVNNHHLHADLMIYEKDVSKIKKGQKIKIQIPSIPDYHGEAIIQSVGKRFEDTPRAVHIHAEFVQKKEFMIPGLYISGKIEVGDTNVTALPATAIIEENGKSYIFSAEKKGNEWHFYPIEIQKGTNNNGWTAITLPKSFKKETKVAWTGAYKLISEMKKSSTSHSH